MVVDLIDRLLIDNTCVQFFTPHKTQQSVDHDWNSAPWAQGTGHRELVVDQHILARPMCLRERTLY